MRASHPHRKAMIYSKLHVEKKNTMTRVIKFRFIDGLEEHGLYCERSV